MKGKDVVLLFVSINVIEAIPGEGIIWLRYSSDDFPIVWSDMMV